MARIRAVVESAEQSRPYVELTVNVFVMRRHPAYAPLRDDPRLQALLNDPKNNAPLF